MKRKHETEDEEKVDLGKWYLVIVQTVKCTAVYT